jgi:hypothetical protein
MIRQIHCDPVAIAAFIANDDGFETINRRFIPNRVNGE